jgi:CRISPR-associated protein Cmr1
MYKAVVNCEVITPMFIAGADGKTPELRAASIKGVLRFWWRALQGEPDLQNLRQRETQLFGGTGEGGGKEGGGRKSAVKIIVKNIRPQVESNPQKFRDDGINYLLYSMVTMREKRPYYKPGSNFDILLLGKDLKQIEEALNALLAASLFGGLGSRTRRGAGGFSIKKVEVNGKAERKWIIPHTDDPYEIKDYINDTVKPITFSPKYTCLSKSKVLIFEPTTNWQSALSVIGNAFKEFRGRNKNEVYKTPAFGFPILHGIRERNIRSFGGFQVSASGKYEAVGRRASPIVLKIIKAGDNYFPVVVSFANEFLPPNFMISSDKDANNKTGKTPDLSLLDKFLNQLTTLDSYSLKISF